MAMGPGKYDELCSQARHTAQAEGAVLIITGGKYGSGFSVQGPIDVHRMLPDMLEGMAEQIRNDWLGSENAGLMNEFHTTAYALLTIGKAAGILANDDVRRDVIAAMQRGSLSPQYIVKLRDQLNDMLRASSHAEPNA